MHSMKSRTDHQTGQWLGSPVRVCSDPRVPNTSPSFSAYTLFKLLNGVFFTKSFYTKVVLKNHIDSFFLKKLANI